MNFDWQSIKDLPEAVPLALAAFPAAILSILTGVVSTLTKAYWDAGRDWTATNPPPGQTGGPS